MQAKILPTSPLLAFITVFLVTVSSLPVGAQEKPSDGEAYVPTTMSADPHGQSDGNQTSGAEGESPVGAPELADIVPLATQLSIRLAALRNEVTGVLDVSVLERKYAEIEIAFPQRDLHLRSLDDSVVLRPPETTR